MRDERFQDSAFQRWLALRRGCNVVATARHRSPSASTIMTSTRTRVIAISLLLLTTACMTWTRPEPPDAALSRVDAKPIQVTRADHSTIILKNASVQDDSLVGIADDGSNTRVAIPISEIQGVSQLHLDTPRSLALTGGVLLSALGLLVIAVAIVATHAKNPLL